MPRRTFLVPRSPRALCTHAVWQPPPHPDKSVTPRPWDTQHLELEKHQEICFYSINAHFRATLAKQSGDMALRVQESEVAPNRAAVAHGNATSLCIQLQLHKLRCSTSCHRVTQSPGKQSRGPCTIFSGERTDEAFLLIGTLVNRICEDIRGRKDIIAGVTESHHVRIS